MKISSLLSVVCIVTITQSMYGAESKTVEQQHAQDVQKLLRLLKQDPPRIMQLLEGHDRRITRMINSSNQQQRGQLEAERDRVRTVFTDFLDFTDKTMRQFVINPQDSSAVRSLLNAYKKKRKELDL